jgi:F-type H+-transporting ATPase subunit epsilon
MKTLHFKIITPERVLFDDHVQQVSLPTPGGEITVLPHHIPVLSLIESGEVRIKSADNKIVPLAISGGFTEVNGDRILLLADTAERVEEIDETRALEAQKRAEELLKEKQVDTQDYALLMAKIEKEMARLRVARKYRK